MGVKGIDIQISANGAAAEAALLRVNEHLKGTGTAGKEAASQISTAMSSIEEALGMVGLTVGLGEGIAKIKEIISSSVDLGMEIGHLSEKTGISTQTLSGLKYVSDVTGVAFESLQRASKKLSTEMLGVEEGNKASIKSFARLGISEQEVKAHSNDLYGMLEILANKFQTMPDGPQKAAIAVQLLGKTGMDLIPVLNQGSAGLAKMKAEAESLGLVLDEAGVAKLQAMHAASVELDGAMQGLALSLTNWLGPSLEGAAKAATELIADLRALKAEAPNTIGYTKYIPQDIYGMQGEQLANKGKSSQGSADAAQAEFMKLDALHVEGAAALKANNDKKLALQREYYLQSQAAAAANLVYQTDRMHNLTEGLAATQSDPRLTANLTAREFSANVRKQKEEIAAATIAVHNYGEVAKDAAQKLADVGKKPGQGLILQEEGGGRGRAGSGSATTDTIPLDPGWKAQLARRGRGQRDVGAEMDKWRNEQNEQAPAVNMKDNGAAMAAGEKLRVQTEALQALDIKGDTIKRESGLIDTQIQQKALSGTLSQHAALEQLNAEHAAEVVRLQALAAEYAAFGDAGRDAYVKIEEEITRTMEQTKKQDKKGEDPAVKALGDGITSMAEKMAQATGKGRQGFHAMAMSMEQDLVELAVKFAAQKWLAPFMSSLGAGMKGGGGSSVGDGSVGGMSGGLPGYAAGGDPTGPSVVGENGPELFFPKGPGTVMPTDALQNLSRSSGGGAPSMTMNVTNASSQPVTARQTGSSFDADTRSYMTHVILEDLSQGGPISSALRPGG